MKRSRFEPTPVRRTVCVYDTNAENDTVSLAIDEVPCRVSKATYARLKRMAIVAGVFLSAISGCAPRSREAVLRDAATAHVNQCIASYGRDNIMRQFWCEEDARRFCSANGLERGCWYGF